MSPSDSGITPLTPQQEEISKKEAAAEGYVRRNLIALDQLGNTLLLNGQPDETISSHTARMATEDKGVPGFVGRTISKALDLIESDHGAKAEAGDVERAVIVVKYEADAGELPVK